MDRTATLGSSGDDGQPSHPRHDNYVSGRTLMLGRIDSHSDNRARYEITGPSDFEVQGTFSDGTPFSGRCGSVTPATAPGTVPIIVNADGTLSYSDAVRP